MTEKDKQVAESFGNLLPKLSELDKERLLMLTALCRPCLLYTSDAADEYLYV